MNLWLYVGNLYIKNFYILGVVVKHFLLFLLVLVVWPTVLLVGNNPTLVTPVKKAEFVTSLGYSKGQTEIIDMQQLGQDYVLTGWNVYDDSAGQHEFSNYISAINFSEFIWKVQSADYNFGNINFGYVAGRKIVRQIDNYGSVLDSLIISGVNPNSLVASNGVNVFVVTSEENCLVGYNIYWPTKAIDRIMLIPDWSLLDGIVLNQIVGHQGSWYISATMIEEKCHSAVIKVTGRIIDWISTFDNSVSQSIAFAGDQLVVASNIIMLNEFGGYDRSYQLHKVAADNGFVTKFVEQFFSGASHDFVNAIQVLNGVVAVIGYRFVADDANSFGWATGYDLAGTQKFEYVDQNINSFQTGVFATDGLVVIGTSDRNVHLIKLEIPGITGVEKFPVEIGDFQLFQNYPNPFNPTTTVSYKLVTGGDVSLTVYNSIGEQVAVLVNSHQASGDYKIQFNAAGLPSGLYICRLTVGKLQQISKMVLLK